MKIRFIPAGVTLLAGAIASWICLMKNYDVTYSLEVLLFVLIIFSFIGFKAQKIIVNVMQEQKLQAEEAMRLAEWQEAEKLRQFEMGKNKRVDEEQEIEEAENDEQIEF